MVTIVLSGTSSISGLRVIVILGTTKYLKEEFYISLGMLFIKSLTSNENVVRL